MKTTTSALKRTLLAASVDPATIPTIIAKALESGEAVDDSVSVDDVRALADEIAARGDALDAAALDLDGAFAGSGTGRIYKAEDIDDLAAMFAESAEAADRVIAKAGATVLAATGHTEAITEGFGLIAKAFEGFREDLDDIRRMLERQAAPAAAPAAVRKSREFAAPTAILTSPYDETPASRDEDEDEAGAVIAKIEARIAKSREAGGNAAEMRALVRALAEIEGGLDPRAVAAKYLAD